MRKEIWHLTEGLLFFHFAVYFLTSTGQGSVEVLALIPGLVAARPWTLVTFQFIHGGMISFFFSMLVLWIMARPLEQMWGSLRFLMFWFISIAGAAGTAMMLGVPLGGDIFLSTSLLFTFATLYPDTEFLLFFILPVKVKYLAVVAGAFLVFSSLSMGLLAGAANVVGMSAGYGFFLVTRKIPTRRQMGFKLAKKRAAHAIAEEANDAAQRNMAWDARVRQAETESRAAGKIPEGLLPLLEELDAARDPSITVCGPEDFHHIDDEVCRTCVGFAECAARAIRAAAEAGETGLSQD
ncbi:MAG: rhomboid family intramembrane serine protease [Thermoanaerobaculales bacterium]|nr:rhomboid family intramembrane serine protease [Thermoanaerobaculales bacterium]